MDLDTRKRIAAIGAEIEGEILDEAALIALGKELTQIAGLCANCGGDGWDDDGECHRFDCTHCLGSGLKTAFNAPPEPVAHQQFAIIHDRNFEGKGLTLAVWNGEQYQTTDGDCYVQDGDRLGPYLAEFLTDYQLQQRLATPQHRDRDEVFDLLRRVVESDIGRTTRYRLSTGQGTQTIDGKSWLAAAAKVAGETAPEQSKPMGFSELVTALKQITAYKPKYQQEYAEEAVVLLEKFAAAANALPFQHRVQPWMMECFGPVISADTQERNHRFLEEALELVQACGATRSEAHHLVDYVYGRPVGEPSQEVGGVMVTLAALCLAQKMDMHAAGEVELARIWTKVDKIRAKQAAKPKHSPLPEAPTPSGPCDKDRRIAELEAMINTPELHDFSKGVVLEAVHQRARWGTDHDSGKAPADWFWLIGFLAQKAMMSHLAGDADKALHHTITTAAAMANWHAALRGETNMRPGIAAPENIS